MIILELNFKQQAMQQTPLLRLNIVGYTFFINLKQLRLHLLLNENNLLANSYDGGAFL